MKIEKFKSKGVGHTLLSGLRGILFPWPGSDLRASDVPHPGRKLTTELVGDVLAAGGMNPIPAIGADGYQFGTQGDRYLVLCDLLPFLRIYKACSIKPCESVDPDKLRISADKVNKENPMINIFISDDEDGGKTVLYLVETIEMTYDHLALSLSSYMDYLRSMVDEHHLEYDRLIQENPYDNLLQDCLRQGKSTYLN